MFFPLFFCLMLVWIGIPVWTIQYLLEKERRREISGGQCLLIGLAVMGLAIAAPVLIVGSMLGRR